MSLTLGSGPFSRHPASQIYERDDGRLLMFDPTPKRVRVRFGGRTIADSCAVKLLHETGKMSVYYFPEKDVDPDALRRSGSLSDETKGNGAKFDLMVDDREAEGAAWRWDDPPAKASFLTGHIAFDFAAMDAWFEEDERIGVHPRDPYHRIDVLRSSRHVRFFVDDVVVADSRNVCVLFETSLPPRFYVPRVDVREELLISSTKTTRCPYKGEAVYWSVRSDRNRDDVVWSYPEPFKEVCKITEMMSLMQEGAGVTLELDGQKTK